ncbi:PmoA family protein [Kineococcus xinjiangensis]|uniref:DUF6807 domain-containing protein n=1 Tax=Kineococcus xinjiangensis TaxID=512762 RepID=UPI000CEBA7D2
MHLDDSTPGRLVVRAGSVDLATYVHDCATDPAVDPLESPKPYLHPLRTLTGAPVSGFRPHDHRWHKGVQFTASEVSGQNFWGGPTYVHGRGYVQLGNVGTMRHDGFARTDAGEVAVGTTENLTWVTSAGEEWVSESRELRFGGVDPVRGLWVLDVATELRNVRGRDLEFGSPTTLGRPAAGYTGLFWRGPRAWTGGTVLTADTGTDADTGTEPMGSASAWLAYSGQHDEVDGGGTLLFLAGTSSADVPLRWFVRSDPFPAVAPSFAFSEEVVLPAGEVLRLRHRIVVGDRAWDRAETEAVAAEHAL